ncbi:MULTISPECIES: hypothetical protein [Streptomyces]|uniref:hypothetical protein n=1 Tax=Streptomyces TaxID=1883 RepID=UPI001E29E3B7|nr:MULTISPECIES: hypothetical protein [Streptomyces]MCZ4101876.1 hypothetical protein [Streptomyces sp. H39-C1]
MTPDTNNQQSEARLRRALRANQAAGPQRTKKSRTDWEGEPAAIYCRISHVNDDDQTGVERQESICREASGATAHRSTPSRDVSTGMACMGCWSP